MRVVMFAVLASAMAGCGKKCLEYDPGQGCELVEICCNPSDSACEYVTKRDEVYECAGGSLNCRAAIKDMLCDVCDRAPNLQDGLGCGGPPAPAPTHPL